MEEDFDIGNGDDRENNHLHVPIQEEEPMVVEDVDDDVAQLEHELEVVQNLEDLVEIVPSITNAASASVIS